MQRAYPALEVVQYEVWKDPKNAAVFEPSPAARK